MYRITYMLVACCKSDGQRSGKRY